MQTVQFGGIYRLHLKNVGQPGSFSQGEDNFACNKLRWEAGKAAWTEENGQRYLIDNTDGDHYDRYEELQTRAFPRTSCFPNPDGTYGPQLSEEEQAAQWEASKKYDSFIKDYAAEIKDMDVEYSIDYARGHGFDACQIHKKEVR